MCLKISYLLVSKIWVDLCMLLHCSKQLGVQQDSLHFWRSVRKLFREEQGKRHKGNTERSNVFHLEKDRKGHLKFQILKIKNLKCYLCLHRIKEVISSIYINRFHVTYSDLFNVFPRETREFSLLLLQGMKQMAAKD